MRIAFLLLCLVTLVSLVWSQPFFWTDRNYSSVELRPNYGVVFTYEGSAGVPQDYWPHTFHLQLPVLPETLPTTDLCAHPSTSGICQEFPLLVELVSNFTASSVDRIRSAVQMIYDLLPESSAGVDSFKSKRSLLPVIGKLSRTLFGTATEDDVETLAAHINSITKSQSELLHAFQVQNDHLSSYMTLSQARLTNFEALFTQQQVDLVDMLNTNRQWVMKSNRDLTLMLQFLFTRYSDYILLTQQITELTAGIQILLTGLLSPSLISADTLRHTITELQNHLRSPTIQAHLVETNPTFYYTSHEFLFVRTGTNLFITIKFPICHDGIATLNVYRVHTFPVPLGNNSDLVTMLSTPSSLFALSSDAAFMAEDIRALPNKGLFQVNMLMQASTSSCLFALFRDLSSSVKTVCTFHVIESQSLPSDLYVVHYPQVLIRSPTLLQVKCPYQFQSPSPCSHCFFTVPCACSVTTRRSYLPARVTQCTADFDLVPESTVKYSVNLALLQHYFDNETLGLFTSATLLDQPLNVSLPPMKFLNHSFDDKLAVSHAIAYDLDRVINATKQDANIYRSMVDPILFGDLVIPTPFFFTPPGYLLIVTSGFSACHAIFTLWLAYRLRLTQAALMGIIHRAHADTLPPYLVVTLPPSSTTTHMFSLGSDSFNYATYLILAIVLVLILRKCYKCRNRHFTSAVDFDVCLEIKSLGRCVFVTIQKVSGCPTDYLVTGTTLSSHITVNGCFRPYLYVTWGNLQIQHSGTGRAIILRNHIPISFMHRFHIAAALSNMYDCFLFFNHAGRGTYATQLERRSDQLVMTDEVPMLTVA